MGSRSPTRLFCGSPLCGLNPMLEPAAAPSSIPQTDDEPPRWQFTSLNGFSRAAGPPLTYRFFALSAASARPQSSAARSAAYLWLAAVEPVAGVCRLRPTPSGRRTSFHSGAAHWKNEVSKSAMRRRGAAAFQRRGLPPRTADCARGRRKTLLQEPPKLRRRLRAGPTGFCPAPS